MAIDTRNFFSPAMLGTLLLVLAMPAAAQVQKLLATDGAAFDEFGISVAVDGDTAVIGALRDDHDIYFGRFNSGSAYVFTRDGSGDWTEQAKLTASDGARDDFFGGSVAVDGDTAVIGAVLDDDNGDRSGSAYVFTRDGSGNWTEQAKLTASDGEASDGFGGSVDIDGDTALIGASGDDDNGDSSGSAYVFTRDGSGNWTEQAKLTASDGVLGDQFGLSVSVDGDTALIGARGDDDNGARSGSAYVFTRDGSGNWTEQDKLTASDGAQDDQFGLSVSVDGDTALIGAHFDDDNGTNSGSAYIFYFAITVTIDIKPGIGPNAINPKSKAVIPLAVLGSSDFDAMLVAWSTVQFGNGEAPPVHYGHVEDVNGDGFLDMVFHFKTQAAGVVCGDTEASFSGRTFGGESITGTDSIRTVACE